MTDLVFCRGRVQTWVYLTLGPAPALTTKLHCSFSEVCGSLLLLPCGRIPCYSVSTGLSSLCPLNSFFPGEEVAIGGGGPTYLMGELGEETGHAQSHPFSWVWDLPAGRGHTVSTRSRHKAGGLRGQGKPALSSSACKWVVGRLNSGGILGISLGCKSKPHSPKSFYQL